ncbi:MAG: hypothetical protein JSS81_19190 [Acidobacteria bacterium]|nr:hypothetical protein [Acidobacteriota bacterium]
MKIIVKAKQAGRRRALFENRAIEIEELGRAPSLETLLRAVVRQQMEEFAARAGTGENLLPVLSKTEIDSQADGGKVGFGAIYNENRVTVEEAQETALLAFADGLFAVFADDREIRGLTDPVELDETTVVTFVRLTFLAGSFW